jgi:hypothetical protein
LTVAARFALFQTSNLLIHFHFGLTTHLELLQPVNSYCIMSLKFTSKLGAFMKTSNKILTIFLTCLSISPLLHANPPWGRCVDGARIVFNFWHAPAKAPFSQPESGSVVAHVKAYNKGFLYNYSAETSKSGMIVSGNGYADATECGNPYGVFQIDIRCTGTKQFSGQETTRHTTLNISNSGPSDGRSLEFDVSCPVSDTGTTLIAPQIAEIKFYE